MDDFGECALHPAELISIKPESEAVSNCELQRSLTLRVLVRDRGRVGATRRAGPVTDPERRHGFKTALAGCSRLLDVYPSLGYDLIVLPKVGVMERADIVLTTLAQQP
jgi:hypothetical protein